MTGTALTEPGGEFQVGECRLDDDADVALDQAWATLDDAERARADSFVFPRDRDRYVRAHGYLRRRLGAVMGAAARDVPIAADAGGKPFVVGGGIAFNLSHSGSHAVVAVTDGREVGIDVEPLDRGLDAQMDGLARLCLTDEERRALKRVPGPARTRRFLAFWTAKEARMKLTGEGMRLEPRTIALDLSDGRPVGYRRPRTPAAELRFVRLSRPDAICCVALVRGAGG